MKALIQKILRENLQLADKIYFNTGVLTQEDKANILRITNGDYLTKVISDMYVSGEFDVNKMKTVYNNLKNYNKNVFPILNLNIDKVEDIHQFYSTIINREKIIAEFSKLPSIAKRNMKEEIRKPRERREMASYYDKLEYFMGNYSLLSNRDESLVQNINKKMFKANITLDDLTDFVEEKSNLLGGEDFTREKIIEIIEDGSGEIVYKKGDIMVVEVSGPETIKELGCNSLWCFTYGRGNSDYNYTDWNNYSYNGVVYVIIDFSEKSDSEMFMHVLVKPIGESRPSYGDDDYDEDDDNDDESLFDMANNPVYNTNSTISHYLDIDKARRVMNFYEEPIEEPKPKPKQHPRPKFKDPNQLELAFEGKKLIGKLLKEALLKEQLTDVDSDVDLLYNKFFKDDLDKLKQTRVLDRNMFKSIETDTSILTSPLAVKAHAMNPCQIITNTTTNSYNPGNKILSLSINDNAINAVFNYSRFNNNIDLVSDYLDVPSFLQEFEPHKIKGTIHHELTHWLDDTLNNGHINNLIKKNMASKKRVGNNGLDINSDKMEIQGQIHNVHQLKKELGPKWDELTFDELFNLSPTLTNINNLLKGEVRVNWRRDLFHRMGREGLVGKNMR